MSQLKMLWKDLNHWSQNILVNMKYISILLLVLLVSCVEEEKPVPNLNWTKEQSVQLGEELAKEEDLRIQLFLERQTKFTYTKTGSGLYYANVLKGEGESKAEEGDVACIDITIMLLDKTVCYETGEDECLELKIDKSEAESGLQEGLKLMVQGDRSMMIIPSHLAHGLVGDQDKIPPLSTLLVDVTLSELVKR